MSLNRFSFITRFLQFGERRTQQVREICFKDFFEKVNENNAKASYPSPYLAVDETVLLQKAYQFQTIQSVETS